MKFSEIKKEITKYLQYDDNLPFVENLKNNRRLLAVILVVICVVAAAGLYYRHMSLEKEEALLLSESTQTSETVIKEESMYVVVDISGAVKNPMVVELTKGSRVEDAINEAGGLLKSADISSVNRAALLEDGQKILIPSKNQSQTENAESSVSSLSDSGIQNSSERVNINTADSDTLRTLDGIGPAMAERIINYRNENGSYKSVEDLKNVKGIGDKTFEKLKDHVCI